jgi:hypothetical protein
MEGIPDFPISIGEFSSEFENLDSISEMAKIVDRHQLFVWKILSRSGRINKLSDKELRMYIEDMIAANLRVLQLELAFILYQKDPERNKEKVDASFHKIEEFVESVVRSPRADSDPNVLKTEPGLAPGLIRRNKTILDTFASIGVDEKEANDAIIAFANKAKNRVWSVDNREDQVREANRNLETRMMQIIGQRNLNVQLPRDRRPSISELVDILITNRVIPSNERSREYADLITRLGDKAARGEQITKEEFVDGDYSLAIGWFEMELDDINERGETIQ